MGTRIATLAREARLDTVLAGRASSNPAVAAGPLNMAWRSAEPEDPAGLDAMLADVRILINTAGPFTHTAAALMRACIRNHCHYLDLSNEAATFQDAWNLSVLARQAGVSLVPGAGFGTAAAEALAAHVIDGIHDPDTLTIVRTSNKGARTPAVSRTTQQVLAQPGAGTKDGKWQALGHGTTSFDLPGGRRTGILVGLGDAFAIAESTGIRHVKAYATTGMSPFLARIIIPIACQLAKRQTAGPQRPNHRKDKPGPEGAGGTQLWIQATTPDGETATSHLQAQSGSELAARIALQAIQQLHSHAIPGVHTAGRLIGTQKVLALPGIQITDLCIESQK